MSQSNNESILIQAAPVQRDAQGMWFHPDMPDFDEGDGDKYKAWLAEQGLTTSTGMLESEGDEHPAYIAYFEKEEGTYLAWDDTPPEGEGWFTLCIADTEDGPAWVWARRTFDSAMQVSK